MDRPRLIRQADRVKGLEKEVPRLVAREDPAGTIAAVRRRGESYEKKAGTRVAEGGQRAAPVDLAPKAARSTQRRLFPPRDEPRTPATGDDLAFEVAELGEAVVQGEEILRGLRRLRMMPSASLLWRRPRGR